MTEFIFPLLGGALIGVAVSLMLFLNGRVTGVIGIVNGTLEKSSHDKTWRFAFLFGLLTGGFTLRFLYPDSLSHFATRSPFVILAAGLLVGFGTIMGGGCQKKTKCRSNPLMLICHYEQRTPSKLLKSSEQKNLHI